MLDKYRRVYDRTILEDIGFRLSSNGNLFSTDYIVSVEEDMLWSLYRRGTPNTLLVSRARLGQILQAVIEDV